MFRRHRVRALLMGGQACILYGAAEPAAGNNTNPLYFRQWPPARSGNPAEF